MISESQVQVSRVESHYSSCRRVAKDDPTYCWELRLRLQKQREAAGGGRPEPVAVSPKRKSQPFPRKGWGPSRHGRPTRRSSWEARTIAGREPEV